MIRMFHFTQEDADSAADNFPPPNAPNAGRLADELLKELFEKVGKFDNARDIYTILWMELGQKVADGGDDRESMLELFDVFTTFKEDQAHGDLPDVPF